MQQPRAPSRAPTSPVAPTTASILDASTVLEVPLALRGQTLEGKAPNTCLCLRILEVGRSTWELQAEQDLPRATGTVHPSHAVPASRTDITATPSPPQLRPS